jgi:hypothetical protein
MEEGKEAQTQKGYDGSAVEVDLGYGSDLAESSETDSKEVESDIEETSSGEDDLEADEELLRELKEKEVPPEILAKVKTRLEKKDIQLEKTLNLLEEQIGISELLEKELEKANENTEKGLSAASEFKQRVEEYDQGYESDGSSMSDTKLNINDLIGRELGGVYRDVINDLQTNKQRIKDGRGPLLKLKSIEKIKLHKTIGIAEARLKKALFEQLQKTKQELEKSREDIAEAQKLSQEEAEKEKQNVPNIEDTGSPKREDILKIVKKFAASNSHDQRMLELIKFLDEDKHPTGLVVVPLTTNKNTTNTDDKKEGFWKFLWDWLKSFWSTPKSDAYEECLPETHEKPEKEDESGQGNPITKALLKPSHEEYEGVNAIGALSFEAVQEESGDNF